MSDTPLAASATSQSSATTTAATTAATNQVQGQEQGQRQEQAQQPFPPSTIDAFLRFCAGEWLSLRSQLTLGMVTPAQEAPAGEGAADGETWHNSERTELTIAYLSPEAAGEPGGLEVASKTAPGQLTQVRFDSDGHFSSTSCFSSNSQGNGSNDPVQSEAPQGRWTLWPDGSLELVISSPSGELCEKIWFTKPNLRLRSTVETAADGSPGRASFSSEIRRVSRPAA
jgi:hypothetical protein